MQILHVRIAREPQPTKELIVTDCNQAELPSTLTKSIECRRTHVAQQPIKLNAFLFDFHYLLLTEDGKEKTQSAHFGVLTRMKIAGAENCSATSDLYEPRVKSHRMMHVQGFIRSLTKGRNYSK